jgi:hypothetical protein
LVAVICLGDSHLTKITFCRATYLCLLAVFYPKKLDEEEAADKEKSKDYPKPPDEPNAFIIRRAFWLSFFLVVISGCVGYAIGYAMFLGMECVNLRTITILQIAGALFLLWGTLFVRGWEIQSWDGTNLTEKVNRWLYRSMYCIGTAIIVCSLVLSPCLK